MRRILMISQEFPPQLGGISSYVEALAEALRSQVIVLAPFVKGADKDDARRKFRIVRRPFFWPSFIWPRWTRLLWHTLKLRKKMKIDMIYLHHILPEGTVALFVKWFTKTPYVVFSHGTDVAACAANAWKKRLVRTIGTHAEQIIVNSESLKRRLLERFPEFEGKVTVMYPCPDAFFLNPVPDETVDTLRHELALEGKKVILSIGRMVDGKGFPHLLRYMPEVVKRVPNAVWLVIGDGPKRADFVRFITEKRLSGMIRYLGAIPHEKLPVYYGLADVFALLTHPDNGLEEGLGLVFLEAAASGVPAVAGQSGGVAEAVVHEQTGYVVDTFQGRPVVETIVSLLQDGVKAEEMGQVARERILQDFTPEEQLQKITPWR